jgi:adenine-specific DNA methylase
MAKARTSTKSKNKAELLQDAIAEAVGAGKELQLQSVDFSSPNRPKTCLEVDFPILPINHVAAIEGNAGKPIYQMSKWWARRRSSVFRAMLIAAATKAPDEPAEAAKLIWDSYYGNHQKNEAFRKLKVADIFMGGGTTIVEGSRLGMQMHGNDLNPVAWLVVKNEMAQVQLDDVQKLLNAIEAEIKPQIMPFYACDCPRGHKGKWRHKATGKTKPENFDPMTLTCEQRFEYTYDGPEVIYTFWAKHGPCQATECNHRTPIMSSPVIAVKTLTVKAWIDKTCVSCGKVFDLEQKDARMAPSATLVVADSEKAFANMDSEGNYTCPHCGEECQDPAAASNAESLALGKSKNKKIDLTLMVHPEWLTGAPGKKSSGEVLGGSVSHSATATIQWNNQRAENLKVVEFRGSLPEKIVLPDGAAFFTDGRGGTLPRRAAFTCKEPTCGLDQDVYESLGKFGTTGPVAIYLCQGYCPTCDKEGQPYGGRFFKTEDSHLGFNAAVLEWNSRKDDDLKDYWPKTEVPFGVTTQIDRPLAHHGYSHWWTFFNQRQLLIHSCLLKAIQLNQKASLDVKLFVLGAFQQYLRNQNMFCIWNGQRDTPEPMFSNNNFAPKLTVVENNVFSKLGRGNWQSCIEGLMETLAWKEDPWELVAVSELERIDPNLANQTSGKSEKTFPKDPVLPAARLSCESSTTLGIKDYSLDLVITDPPFGDLLHYSELSDFFYAWLRLALDQLIPDYFSSEHTPKALEAVANKARQPDDHGEFYQRVLTTCWREAARILRPAGILAFTFHHSEDEPWIAVLESLFDAGFLLEATFPIRSDESKGKGEFGSQQIEFDIVHVCRKRLDEPSAISWARLRRQIMRDVQQLQDILEHHQKEGLGEADLQVIRRGKALEYFSRHYGKVYIEKGREEEFTVKDALVGINQLLDDESDTSTDRPPESAEPYTRQFLRLFADKVSLDRDQIQKYLRGTGVSPSEFVDRGWCTEEKKIFTIADPLAWAQDWKGKSRRTMARDFDQAYFLIGASYENSGIKVSDTLSSESFVPHPALGELLTWFGKHSPTEEMRSAARRAQQLYSAWQAKNTKVAVIQRTLFDLEE